jgi:hypothetical protein
MTRLSPLIFGWIRGRRAVAAILAVAIGAMLAGDIVAPLAYAQSSGEIVVAQNNHGPGGFFRRLFGGNRRRQQRQELPQPRRDFQIFPGLEEPEQQRPERRERRARTAAPQPREVAAVEKAENAKRALVVGDFMATALAKGLAETYRENANVVVIDATSGSSGLVRQDYFDWPGKLAEIVTEQKPDAILVMIGGNDRQTLDGSLELGSDAWRTAYTQRVAALADALKATGKPVIWGGLVSVESSAMSRDYSSFNGIVREQAEAKGLRFVDMWNGFADEDGKYVSFGPDVRGQSVQLRADDGLNFTRAGQRKLAYFVEQQLNDMFGGIGSLIATVGPGAEGGIIDARIGPMQTLDALSLMGGDDLARGVTSSRDRGKVAADIAARITQADATPPPKGRADSYTWPPPTPPPTIQVSPDFSVPRGPR